MVTSLLYYEGEEKRKKRLAVGGEEGRLVFKEEDGRVATVAMLLLRG